MIRPSRDNGARKDVKTRRKSGGGQDNRFNTVTGIVNNHIKQPRGGGTGNQKKDRGRENLRKTIIQATKNFANSKTSNQHEITGVNLGEGDR